MIKPQWFVKMEELAKPAIEAVKNGDLKFVPERYTKTYLHWLENIRDWCISRQLWWGHRIPAYYCDECGEVVVARETPEVCPKCGCKHFTQDEDTLDTWFSSALWPFSTLGWPEKTKELDYFYPTNTLVTGYDIIFFWVIRMIFSGYEQMGEKPFKTVLFHGLVRDSQGRKMSKSLGNGIDPLEIIDQYGADALRLTLITGNAPGNDMRFYYERVESSRNFANKIKEQTKNKSSRIVERIFFANSSVLNLDKQGRALIPARLREYAGLKKDLVFIGMINHIEIWAKEEVDFVTDPEEFGDFEEALAEMGISSTTLKHIIDHFR